MQAGEYDNIDGVGEWSCGNGGELNINLQYMYTCHLSFFVTINFSNVTPLWLILCKVECDELPGQYDLANIQYGRILVTFESAF